MMKGWLFERSREDARLLLSKLGFAVSLPLAAGYLAVNPNQPSSNSSSSSARAEPGAGGEAPVHASTEGGRHLIKDEIHVQEREEALAKIIHGDSGIESKDHPPSGQNLLDEEGFLLPPLKQLPLQRPESGLMRLTHNEFKVNEAEMEQEMASIQEEERSRLLDCYSSKNKQVVRRETEDQLRINLMKAKSLSLKIKSLDEVNQLARIGDLEYSEMIGELESVIMIINRLIRALKSDRWNSRRKRADIEQRITMLDDKSDSKPRADANSNMLTEVEDEFPNLSMIKLSTELKNSESVERLEYENVAAYCCSPKGQEVEEELGANFSVNENEKKKETDLLPDYYCAEIKKMSHVWMINNFLKCDKTVESSTDEPTKKCTSESLNVKFENIAEQKSLELVDKLEFGENVASPDCIPNDEEVEEEFETNRSAEADEEEMEIKNQDDITADNLNMPKVWQVNSCSKSEQGTGCFTEKSAECCKIRIWDDETQKTSQQLVVESANLGIDPKNKYQDFDAGNSSLQRISNESTSYSSDTCSTTSNSSVAKSKHHSLRRKKVLSKLQKLFLGKKHNDRSKGKTSADKAPLSSASSDTTESVSTSCSEDARRNLFSDSDLSGFSKQHDSTKHLLETKSRGNRWQNNTAWCHSFFRSPFEISRTKIFAVQDEYMSNVKKPVIRS